MTQTLDPLDSTRVLLDPMHATRAHRTGRGVSIGVIDSGVNPWNPHVARIAGTVAFHEDGSEHRDVIDRLGHGTAVVAAVQEKAPNAELHVIRVFEHALSTSARAIANAIDWAVDQGLRLVNLSLGTVKPHSIGVLTEAVRRADEHGTIVVSASQHDGERWYPGSLPLVAGVVLDWSCPRETIWIQDKAGTISFGGSGYPRPVPGVAPERNLKGVSFAVANVTGALACVLEAHSDVRSVRQVVQLTGALHGA
jgi:subtilisin family serine protease